MRTTGSPHSAIGDAPIAGGERQHQRQRQADGDDLADQQPVGIDRGGKADAIGQPGAHQRRQRRLHHRDAAAHRDGGGKQHRHVGGRPARRRRERGEEQAGDQRRPGPEARDDERARHGGRRKQQRGQARRACRSRSRRDRGRAWISGSKRRHRQHGHAQGRAARATAGRARSRAPAQRRRRCARAVPSWKRQDVSSCEGGRQTTPYRKTDRVPPPSRGVTEVSLQTNRHVRRRHGVLATGQGQRRNRWRLRNLGTSGLRVSVVGLGCNNFGGRIDLEASRAVVHKALDLGITLFDTADTYGNRGGSEECLGADPGRAAQGHRAGDQVRHADGRRRRC